jgi:hypothetical protein
MQGATLIVWIGAAVFVPATVMMSVMMVNLTHLAAFSEVPSNVLLVLEGMLNMGAEQRHDAYGLGHQDKPQEQWTKAP